MTDEVSVLVKIEMEITWVPDDFEMPQHWLHFKKMMEDKDYVRDTVINNLIDMEAKELLGGIDFSNVKSIEVQK